MTVDASRSCLGLGTCVGSASRQIVDARVLLTATAPPALPGSPMLGGSLAPPLAAIIGLVRSVCRHRHLSGDGPHEARQFAGDRGGDDVGRLCRCGRAGDSARTTAVAPSRRCPGSAWAGAPAATATRG